MRTASSAVRHALDLRGRGRSRWRPQWRRRAAVFCDIDGLDASKTSTMPVQAFRWSPARRRSPPASRRWWAAARSFHGVRISRSRSRCASTWATRAGHRLHERVAVDDAVAARIQQRQRGLEARAGRQRQVRHRCVCPRAGGARTARLATPEMHGCASLRAHTTRHPRGERHACDQRHAFSIAALSIDRANRGGDVEGARLQRLIDVLTRSRVRAPSRQ